MIKILLSSNKMIIKMSDDNKIQFENSAVEEKKISFQNFR